MVGLGGLEPPRLRSSAEKNRWFNHFLKWWVWVDLNHRPRTYQARTLTN